jgi:hypothetical protein
MAGPTPLLSASLAQIVHLRILLVSSRVPLAVGRPCRRLFARFYSQKGDKMRKYLIMLVAAAVMAAPSLAGPGYQGITGVDRILTPDSDGDGIASIGDLFRTPEGAPGTFTWFQGNTPNDPTIENEDLHRYRYTLDGMVAEVNRFEDYDKVLYRGDYSIYYADPTLGNLRVSAGDFMMWARFAHTAGGVADLVGTLNQLQGPEHPVFADLGYLGPAYYAGTYTPVNFGVDGTIQGRIVSPIPEPGSMALLATGVLPLLALRRRRRAA